MAIGTRNDQIKNRLQTSNKYLMNLVVGIKGRDMRNYRFAFFTVDWNYELVENTMCGLKQFVRDHENVQLCIFDCFGQEISNAKNKIEYSVFDLVDLNEIDGLLIQGNQVVLQDVRQDISRRVLESHIPAVSVDCPIEGCVWLGLDNLRAQYDITKHVIEKHGARRLVYLTGLLHNGSPSGELRKEGFLEACSEHGLKESDVTVIECTWRAEDGEMTARRWINEGRDLPDAFICSNDEMALGLIEIFQAAGVRIPEDVIVTGFDNVSSAVLSSPQLTTVNRDFDNATYSAMQILLKMVEGKSVEQKIPLQYQVVCSESCGCSKAASSESIVDRYFMRSRFLRRFHAQQAQLVEELMDVSDLPQLMDILGGHHEIFGCDKVYLCVNDYYFDNYEREYFLHDTETFGEYMVVAQHRPDGSLIFERFPTKHLLPEYMIGEERFLLFYPIHYNTCSIGYLVMNDMNEAAQMGLHENLFSFLEIALENVRKKGRLRHLNSMLDSLYVRDKMTGLFNRFGYDRFAGSVFDKFMTTAGGAQIVFIDMDGLKAINDCYGHEMGDEAIVESAQTVQSICGSGDFVMRYGGDEFLVITSIQDTGYERRLRDALSLKNEIHKRPYALSLSVGTIKVPKDSCRTLDACVKEADALMYENKKQRRLSRG